MHQSDQAKLFVAGRRDGSRAPVAFSVVEKGIRSAGFALKVVVKPAEPLGRRYWITLITSFYGPMIPLRTCRLAGTAKPINPFLIWSN